MTSMISTPNTDSVTGLVSSVTSNVFLVLSTVTSTAVSLLPGSMQSAVLTAFSSVQTLLAERWELRALAIVLMAPTALFLLFLSSLALALLWPFAFLATTIEGTALIAWYLFQPSSTDVKTCFFSLAFAMVGQLLVGLPVYLLAPFSLFVLLLASSVYALVARDTFDGWAWPLLAVNAWWLLTTPYWSIIHFVTFPFLFAFSLGLQFFVFAAGFVAVSLFPELPSTVQRYYADLVEQRSARALPKPTADHTAYKLHSAAYHKKGEGERQAPMKEEHHLKEEAKSQ